MKMCEEENLSSVSHPSLTNKNWIGHGVGSSRLDDVLLVILYEEESLWGTYVSSFIIVILFFF